MTTYHLCKRHRSRWITVATLTASTCLAWADYGFHYHGLNTSAPDLRVCHNSVQSQKNWAGYAPDAVDLECEESDIWYQRLLEIAWHSARCYKTWEYFCEDQRVYSLVNETQVLNVMQMFNLSLTLKP